MPLPSARLPGAYRLGRLVERTAAGDQAAAAELHRLTGLRRASTLPTPSPARPAPSSAAPRRWPQAPRRAPSRSPTPQAGRGTEPGAPLSQFATARVVAWPPTQAGPRSRPRFRPTFPTPWR